MSTDFYLALAATSSLLVIFFMSLVAAMRNRGWDGIMFLVLAVVEGMMLQTAMYHPYVLIEKEYANEVVEQVDCRKPIGRTHRHGLR